MVTNSSSAAASSSFSLPPCLTFGVEVVRNPVFLFSFWDYVFGWFPICLSGLSVFLSSVLQNAGYLCKIQCLHFVTGEEAVGSESNVLLVLCFRQFPLPPHFQNFFVGIGMLVRNVSRAGSGSVLG